MSNANPSPMMLLIGAAQHPRYIEVADASGCERDFVADLIELAESIEVWGRAMIAEHPEQFEKDPFAFEYTVQEALGRRIIETIGERLDLGQSNPFVVTPQDCRAFARRQHVCLKEDI